MQYNSYRLPYCYAAFRVPPLKTVITTVTVTVAVSVVVVVDSKTLY